MTAALVADEKWSAFGSIDGKGPRLTPRGGRRSPKKVSSQPVVMRPQLQSSEGAVRPTRAEIDLGAIGENYRAVQGIVGDVDVLAVVKADAYGHGVIPVAKHLESVGVFGFGVALAEEGLELRDAGIGGAILVLNGVYGGAHREVLARGLTPVVYELEDIEAFAAVAGPEGFGVHLHVDTGMRRLGVPLRELPVFLERSKRFAGLRIEGLMTHLAAADDPDVAFTKMQLANYAKAEAFVLAAGHRPKVHHVANTAATFCHAAARRNWVRPGLALYGYPGAPGVDVPLRPAMRWRSELIQLRRLQPGDRVGYNGTFTAEREMTVAAIPVGYGDGLMCAAATASVLVRGRRCPIVGRISMDLATIDVSAVAGVCRGDEAVLLGAQRFEDTAGVFEDFIGAEELAQHAGTIPYEVLCAVSRRVPRFYRS